MTGLYGAELGVFTTHQRRQNGLQAPSATDGQDTEPPLSVEAGPSRHRDTGRRSHRCHVASARVCRAQVRQPASPDYA